MRAILLACGFAFWMGGAELSAQSDEKLLAAADKIKFSRLREFGMTTDEIATGMLKGADTGLPLSRAFRTGNAWLAPIFSSPYSEGLSKGTYETFMVPGGEEGFDMIVSRLPGPDSMSVFQTVSLWGVRFRTSLGLSGVQERVKSILKPSRGNWTKRPGGTDRWVFVPDRTGAAHPFLDLIFLDREGETVLVWGIRGAEGTAYLLNPERDRGWFAEVAEQKNEFESLTLPFEMDQQRMQKEREEEEKKKAGKAKE